MPVLIFQEGLDTRAIKGVALNECQNACISTEALTDAEAVERARAFTGLVGVDFVQSVDQFAPYQWRPQADEAVPFSVEGTNIARTQSPQCRFKLAAIDFGARGLYFSVVCINMASMFMYFLHRHRRLKFVTFRLMRSSFRMGLEILLQWAMPTRQSNP